MKTLAWICGAFVAGAYVGGWPQAIPPPPPCPAIPIESSPTKAAIKLDNDLYRRWQFEVVQALPVYTDLSDVPQAIRELADERDYYRSRRNTR